MLATIFTGTARYRRQVLATTVVLAASLLLLRPGNAPASKPFALLVLAFAVLGLLAQYRPRPAALTVDPRRRAFRALPAAWSVYLVGTLIFISAEMIGNVRRSFTDTGEGPHHLDLLDDMNVLAVGLCAVILVREWRGLGVELRPDGLIDHGPFGTLTVPWEALAPGYPRPGPGRSLVLAYARPELVRRHIVFSRRRLAAHLVNVDPLFLGAVIAHYVAYPQYRPAIGTQAEYDRLLHVMSRSALA